ncbi:hypothetical protein [Acinetobacter pollinis]|uniref:hypothetical protein n=1 Tax=Acinetobacter pollinis TaxID=2605270 RepID=UPI0018A2EB26|nr:hypothetical protein [Acinetobacter pollinis]MBF7690859.1 hypothetical protein [Acinetobacter pollinis]MBF7698504.1 hypothetical protein [Acinetobacter pollinis]
MTTNVGITNRRENSAQQASFSVRYTRSIDTNGWLKVRLEPNGEFIYLCEYTKVLIQRSYEGRTFFLINEGIYANKTASLSNSNSSKCLISYKRGIGATLNVKVVGRKNERSLIRNENLDQLFAELSFNGVKARITLDSGVHYRETNRNSPSFGQVKQSQPLPKGIYNIMAPDYAKDAAMTAFYRTSPNGFSGLQYDTAWFPIEYAPTHNSNFVHVGHLSEGCITCYEVQKWNDLYQYLITNRTPDGKYVGKLIIS